MTDPFLSELAITFKPDEFLVHPLADTAACDLNTSTQPPVRSSHEQTVGWRRSSQYGWMEAIRSADSWLKAFGSVNGWTEAFRSSANDGIEAFWSMNCRARL